MIKKNIVWLLFFFDSSIITVVFTRHNKNTYTKSEKKQNTKKSKTKKRSQRHKM